jgi:RNA polymerase sigma factor (sigma-70 family)
LLISMERGWNAEKRGRGQKPLSLQAPIGRDRDGDPATLGDLIPERCSSDPTLRLDIASAVARLTQRQRAVVRHRLEGLSVTEIARRMKVSRETAHQELARIKCVFEDAGLRDYLG